MTTALLFILAWTLVALVVGVVVGRSIHNRDQQVPRVQARNGQETR